MSTSTTEVTKPLDAPSAVNHPSSELDKVDVKTAGDAALFVRKDSKVRKQEKSHAGAGPVAGAAAGAVDGKPKQAPKKPVRKAEKRKIRELEEEDEEQESYVEDDRDDPATDPDAEEDDDDDEDDDEDDDDDDGEDEDDGAEALVRMEKSLSEKARFYAMMSEAMSIRTLDCNFLQNFLLHRDHPSETYREAIHALLSVIQLTNSEDQKPTRSSHPKPSSRTPIKSSSRSS
jgi:hypothetical protein